MNDRPFDPVRALVDANLLISILLSADPERSAPAALLAAANRGAFVPVVPPEALAEVARVVAEKPWLAARITSDQADALLHRIMSVAKVPQRLKGPLPRMCRDPGDDYLIAHAVLAEVDFLITRDRDLLDLGNVGAIRIVDPVAFLALLRATQDTSDSG